MKIEQCRGCKHLGESAQQSHLNERLCTLHNGMLTREDYCACYWWNKDIKLSANQEVSEHGTIINREYVKVWEGAYCKRLAYYIAEYSGRWYSGSDFNMNEWGSCSLPNIHGSSFDTRKEAIESVLRMGLRDAREMRKDNDINLFEKAIMDNSQLTLF